MGSNHVAETISRITGGDRRTFAGTAVAQGPMSPVGATFPVEPPPGGAGDNLQFISDQLMNYDMQMFAPVDYNLLEDEQRPEHQFVLLLRPNGQRHYWPGRYHDARARQWWLHLSNLGQSLRLRLHDRRRLRLDRHGLHDGWR
ncbi:MAG: hypothetical protein R3B96_24485 [Pirellulaceae bacterium]